MALLSVLEVTTTLHFVCEIFFFVVLLHVSELLKMILLNFQCFSIVYELNHPVWFLIPAFPHYALTA